MQNYGAFVGMLCSLNRAPQSNLLHPYKPIQITGSALQYKTIEKINVLYCTSVTKQCFHVQREKCVCLTYGLPFGNKCIHLNQNGMFFTITVFCTPDVRNMLLEEQTKNLEWLILPKACV